MQLLSHISACLAEDEAVQARDDDADADEPPQPHLVTEFCYLHGLPVPLTAAHAWMDADPRFPVEVAVPGRRTEAASRRSRSGVAATPRRRRGWFVGRSRAPRGRSASPRSTRPEPAETAATVLDAIRLPLRFRPACGPVGTTQVTIIRDESNARARAAKRAARLEFARRLAEVKDAVGWDTRHYHNGARGPPPPPPPWYARGPSAAADRNVACVIAGDTPRDLKRLKKRRPLKKTGGRTGGRPKDAAPADVLAPRGYSADAPRWIVGGDASRRRRGWDVDSPCVAAPPRLGRE